MKKVIIAVASAAILSACGATGPTKSLEDANAAIVTASGANEKVKKVNYEWRDTGKLIKSARDAKGKGEFDEAVKLANKAKFQGDMGYEQAMGQKDIKPWLF